ncbi:MAG: long-chain fatty acid--CoA ligase [Euryarchaeota archaeon]|nr:long-chain fatty acid--CoA ligase [Euryarchaeota archaeon]
MTHHRPWFAHYPREVPREIQPVGEPLDRFLRKAARQFPDRAATVFFGGRLTYRELDGRADRLAAALAGMGVKKGDRVAVYLPNCPAYVIAYYAVLRLGAVLVNNNPLYVERELEHQLNDSGAETLIYLNLFHPTVQALRGKVPVKRSIHTSFGPYLPPAIRPLFNAIKQKKLYRERNPQAGPLRLDPDALCMERLIRDAPPDPPKVSVEPSDLALLQYTGGTTGRPKGAMLTHGSVGSNVLQVAPWFYNDKPGQMSLLLVMPLFHAYGMIAMFQATYMASTMILMPRFVLEDALKAINKYQPTNFPGVPTIYNAIASHPEISKYRVSSIRTCLSGAAPLPVEVLEKFEKATGGRLCEGFGLTEASPVTHVNPVSGTRKVGSIGPPLPSTDARIVDLNDPSRELPPGQEGELLISGPQVMAGYWNRPEETRKTIRNGWLHTGDIAKMDPDGYFYIVDRAKDLIIASGYNIYPREIEEVLYEHPKVQEAGVVGVKDEYRGEAPKAFIVLKPGETATPEEFIAYCKTKLAVYKVPKLIEFRKELPKTAIGKVLRKDLREEKAPGPK